jgi:hypothetical protein
MTTKQSIRKVLTNTNKFIIGDYHGQKWYCPDGYIATSDNIYDQYKPKKSQLNNFQEFIHVNNQPKMETIINNQNSKYIPVEQLNKSYTEGTLYLQAGDHKVLVNKVYYELMETLYPTGIFYIDSYYSYSAVRIVVKNYTAGDLYKIVGLIMPLKD